MLQTFVGLIIKMVFAALLTVFRQPTFKWIMIVYFLLALLSNDVISYWNAEAFIIEESQELVIMSGRVLRVLVLNVLHIYFLILFKIKFKKN